MKRVIVLAIGMVLLTAACAGRGAGSFGAAPRGERPTAESPAGEDVQESPEGQGGSVTFEVWFASHYESVGEGAQTVGGTGLFVTKRTQPSTPAVGRAALTALFEGPSPEEGDAGVYSAVPEGTELRDLRIEGGIATVDLSREFEAGSGTHSEIFRIAQVVYTLTQFPTVDGVEFRIEGEPVTEFASHGLILDGPQSRGDYEEMLPPILVQTPTIGQRVSSPVTVAGLARVFEATVSIRILDADGGEIARTFTTATCGGPCRGEYSASVTYGVDSEQPGTIEAFEASAVDGSPGNVVRIPVTLVP